MGTIAITMDMDWAPDEVIKDSLDLLSYYNISATLFMTNKIKINTERHEIGIHPYFTSFDFEKHLQERLVDFPGSAAVRSHQLFENYPLQFIYKKHGIRYKSNVMLLLQHGIQPNRITQDMWEFPIFWMDIPYMEIFNHRPTFLLRDLDIEQPGLKIFDFHPSHIFLNTCSVSQYEEAKKYYHDTDEFLKYRNNSKPGIRNLFIELLEYLKSNSIKPKTLSQLYSELTN